MFVIKYKVDFLKHPGVESNEASKSHDSRFSISRRDTPQLSLNFSQATNAVMRKTKLFVVRLVLSFTHNQGKRRPRLEQISGEGLVDLPIRLDKLLDSLLD